MDTIISVLALTEFIEQTVDELHCRDCDEYREGQRTDTQGGLGSFPHPVHDVQLTAESLDGTADLQQLQSQSVINGQTSSHPVGEV